MDLYTAVSRSRTGQNAANANASAARLKALKQSITRTETTPDRRGNSRPEPKRARDKDRYEPGAAAYVARTQMRKPPDQQSYTPHPRVERNHHAESRRSGRA
jgi:hypothetical protein